VKAPEVSAERLAELEEFRKQLRAEEAEAAAAMIPKGVIVKLSTPASRDIINHWDEYCQDLERISKLVSSDPESSWLLGLSETKPDTL
jgi:hypothetical protein